MFCQGFASTSEPLGKRLLALLETDVMPSPLSLPSLERFRGALRLLYCHDNRYAPRPSLERFRGALRLLYCHDNRYAPRPSLERRAMTGWLVLCTVISEGVWFLAE